MANNQYDIIFKTRHPLLKEKEKNWELIYNAYLGGTSFSNGNYLIKYPKESNKSFQTRKTRAVYFNQLSPVVDMISGLLYMNPPVRKIPKELEYLLDNVSGNKKIDEFMRIVSAHSFMFTCGVLVDAPGINPEMIRTERDRLENKVQPYAVLYLPFRIRDFNINIDDGQLDWVLLDNSYMDMTDPFTPRKYIIKYTLWTRDFWQDFSKEEKSTTVEVSEEHSHDLGIVPFRFVAWRDDNNDFISETVCEDIAMISKLIYNNMSYMDEMLASGTFKMLAYPSADGSLPVELSSGGIGALSAIPYDITSSSQPDFIGADLDQIDPFIKAIEFYMAEVLKKVGLSTDETKEFVKSGAAKRIDMQKMKALLVTGSMMMGKLEEWIFSTAAKWEGRSTEGINVEYDDGFSDEDLRTEVTMLTELLVHPVKKLRVNVLQLLSKKILGRNLDADTLGEIYKDIEGSITENPLEGKTSQIDTEEAAAKIKAEQQTEEQDNKESET